GLTSTKCSTRWAYRPRPTSPSPLTGCCRPTTQPAGDYPGGEGPRYLPGNRAGPAEVPTLAGMTVTTVLPAASPVGDMLRQWRQRRRPSQLDLAIEADISPRPLSFLETRRSKPARPPILPVGPHRD